MKRLALLCMTAVLTLLMVTGCSSAPVPDSGDTAVPAQVSAEAPPATVAVIEPTAETIVEPTTDPAAISTTLGTAPVMAKVNANTASEEDLTAAFTAAGIDNAGKWADEVVEYRPYPTDDPNFTKLREELAKYNPAAGVVDQIVAILEP